MNKVIIIGRLTRDPELRTTESGVSSCRFSVAVNRRFKNQSGEYDADFISCVAWRQTAEFISRYFSKGQMIALEGTLRTGSYKDKTHPDITHYTTDVYVDNAEFCGSKNDNGGSGNTYAPAAQSVVRSAQDQGITTDLSYGSASEFEELLSGEDVPF
jgi:single-strand DNA-binding protein